MTCEACGCTDDDACVDEETLETCSWAVPGLCSFCAERREAFEREGACEPAIVMPEALPAGALFDAYGVRIR